MKATISMEGNLIVWPENELEAYAIAQWNKTHPGSQLIDHDVFVRQELKRAAKP